MTVLWEGLEDVPLPIMALWCNIRAGVFMAFVLLIFLSSEYNWHKHSW